MIVNPPRPKLIAWVIREMFRYGLPDGWGQSTPKVKNVN